MTDRPIVADLGRPETPEEEAARKAESSRRHRDSTTTRNLLIALGVSLALVLFNVLSVARVEQPPRPAVDYALIASQSSASVPLATPELPEGWLANDAQLRTGSDDVAAWYIGFITPENQFASMTQGIDANPSWVSGVIGTVQATGTTTINGVEWTVYDNRDAEDPGNYAYVLVAEIDGSTYVLYGTAPDEEFVTLAKAVA